nr:ribonuclease H-like domain, reverse transcriptase, RNA-dependent DNA polymerase [Tanacetum cinerariifolium]
IQVTQKKVKKAFEIADSSSRVELIPSKTKYANKVVLNFHKEFSVKMEILLEPTSNKLLVGQPKLGLWYPKDSPFDLKAYTYSDYAGASLDRKSTIGGCQFLGSRLMSWKCKKQTVVANSTTEAEYIVAYTYYCQLKVYAAREEQIQALVDKKKVIITEISVRSYLHLEDAKGTKCLPTATIFEQLTLIGAKTTTWNEFSSTMASAIISLATNQKFNFFKYNFDHMVKNLEDGVKFLMFPRFVQVFLDSQVECMLKHKEVYVTPSHTKKIFANMKRHGKDFSDEHMTTTFYDLLLSANQALEIGSLKRRVKKLDKKASKKTHKLKRLYKIGSLTRVKSSEDVGLGDQEDASKQGRMISDLDADEGVALVDETQGGMIKTCLIQVYLMMKKLLLKRKLVLLIMFLLLTSKIKEKGIVMQDPSETPTLTPIDSSQEPSKAKDKESFVPMDTELVKGSEKAPEGSSKREGGKVEQSSEPQPPSSTTPPEQVLATVGDEAVYTGEDDKVVRAVATVGTGSGSTPWRYVTTLRDTDAQTRLKEKVKRLEKKQKARTPGMKHFKIGTFKKKTLDKEYVSKQGRDESKRIEELNLSNKESGETKVFDYTTAAVKDVNAAEPDSIAGDVVNAASVNPDASAAGSSTSVAGPSTSSAKDIFEDEMTTMADTLMAIRWTRPRTTSVVIHDVKEEPRRAIPLLIVQSHDKGKGKMVEPKPISKNPIKA